MKKYLLLLYEDERQSASNGVNNELFRLHGRLLAGGWLHSADSVVTVSREVDSEVGRATVEVGPAIEAAVEMRAFYLINAFDLNEAIQVAMQLPQARNSVIEVRPVAE